MAQEVFSGHHASCAPVRVDIWSPPIFLIIFPLTEKALGAYPASTAPPIRKLFHGCTYVFAPRTEGEGREIKAQWEVGTSFKSCTRTSYILLMRLAPSTLTCLRPFHTTDLHLFFEF